MSKHNSSFIIAAILAAIGAILVARGDGINNPGISGLSGDCIANLGSPTIGCNSIPYFGYVVNNWYLPVGMQTAAASAAMAANFIQCGPGGIAAPVTINAIGIAISTLSAGGNVQMAIYTNVSDRPGVLIASTPSSGTGAVATVSSPITATMLGPGTANGSSIWWCYNLDNNVVRLVASLNTSGFAQMVGDSTITNVLNTTTAGAQGVNCNAGNCTGGSSAFGNWPATLVGSTWGIITANQAARMAFKVQSAP